MFPKKKSKPQSLKYTNLAPKEPVSTLSMEKTARRATSARKPLNKVGRKGEWSKFVNCVLDLFFERLEIDYCEVPYHHDCWSEVHYSHSEKRVEIPIGSPLAFDVLRACDVEHNKYEAKGRDVNRETVFEGIVQRHMRLAMDYNTRKDLLKMCIRDVQEQNPKWDYEIDWS